MKCFVGKLKTRWHSESKTENTPINWQKTGRKCINVPDNSNIQYDEAVASHCTLTLSL